MNLLNKTKLTEEIVTEHIRCNLCPAASWGKTHMANDRPSPCVSGAKTSGQGTGANSEQRGREREEFRPTLGKGRGRRGARLHPLQDAKPQVPYDVLLHMTRHTCTDRRAAYNVTRVYRPAYTQGIYTCTHTLTYTCGHQVPMQTSCTHT